MKLLLSLLLMTATGILSAQTPEYKVVKTFPVSGDGFWDYIAVHDGKIYVSHSTQVNILNEENGDSIGIIPNTKGVHEIAFDDQLQKGFTSNGALNTVTVFDLKSGKVTGQVSTGEDPDAIFFEPYTKKVVTCNGRSEDLSVIDPSTEKVVETIKVGGKPETAVSDGKGKLFVNIENKNEIAEVDLKTFKVTNQWPLDGAEGPTGLVIDKSTNRLFAGCQGWLVVMNASNGKVVAKLPTGQGCDGVAFYPKNKMIFSSNGRSATITAIKEKDANDFSVVGNYPTQPGARTIAIDEDNGALFLPTASFEKNNGGGRPKMIPGTFRVLVVKKVD